MEIQALAPGDVRATAELLRGYWNERRMHYSKQWAESYVRKGHALELVRDTTFVAKEGSALVGVVAVLIFEGEVAELRDLVVRKELRGKGYGNKLVNHALAVCQQHNLRKVYALVFPQHQKFFEGFGFYQEGYLKSHFADGENLVFMSKILQRREQQKNLKKQLETISLLQDIEEKTSERLRRTRNRVS